MIKKHIHALYYASALIMLMACESHEQPSESAFLRIRKEKLIQLDSSARVAEEQEQIQLQNTPAETLVGDDWYQFKTETTQQLDKNSRSISRLKQIPELRISLFKKATVLENENHNLRLLLDNFSSTEKEVQSKFISSMKEDLNELSEDITNLKIKQAG